LNAVFFSGGIWQNNNTHSQDRHINSGEYVHRKLLFLLSFIILLNF